MRRAIHQRIEALCDKSDYGSDFFLLRNRLYDRMSLQAAAQVVCSTPVYKADQLASWIAREKHLYRRRMQLVAKDIDFLPRVYFNDFDDAKRIFYLKQDGYTYVCERGNDDETKVVPLKWPSGEQRRVPPKLLLRLSEVFGEGKEKAIKSVLVAVPFEHASALVGQRRVVLNKGIAWIELSALVQCYIQRWDMWLKKLVTENVGKATFFKRNEEPQVKEIVSCWRKMMNYGDLHDSSSSGIIGDLQEGGKIAVRDIEELPKPACMANLLAQYPAHQARKVMTNYLSRLGVPPTLPLKTAWNATIIKKHGGASATKQIEIEKEIRGLASTKNKASFNCFYMGRNGLCPYVKPGQHPGQVLKQCFGTDKPAVAHPVAWTRVRVVQQQQKKQNVAVPMNTAS